jgi:bacterioferritin-associated ferredoxin
MPGPAGRGVGGFDPYKDMTREQLEAYARESDETVTSLRMQLHACNAIAGDGVRSVGEAMRKRIKDLERAVKWCNECREDFDPENDPKCCEFVIAVEARADRRIERVTESLKSLKHRIDSCRFGAHCDNCKRIAADIVEEAEKD